jgi:hypothetical protein
VGQKKVLKIKHTVDRRDPGKVLYRSFFSAFFPDLMVGEAYR